MDPVLITLLAEFAKFEIASADAELNATYADGGRASGARRERMAKAVADAYELAKAAVAALPQS